MSLLDTVIPTAGVAGVGGWMGQVVFQWFKNRGDNNKARVDADAQLEQHRDRLTFDLLSAARSELSIVRAEVAELRPLQTKLAQLDSRLAHFEEAIDHLETILSASNDTERTQAERLARAFVVRMRRLAEAHGTLMNEAQRELSGAALKDAGGLADIADRIP